MGRRLENLGFLLNKTTRLLKWEFDKRLKEFDLTTPQWSVLIDIAMQASNNGTSPAEVAERLNMDRPTISGIIERLGKKELIVTEPHPKDRRYQIIKLTPSAKELLPKLESLSEDVISLATNGVSENEQRILKGYLNMIISNLSK